jgi:hypothetical protein
MPKMNAKIESTKRVQPFEPDHRVSKSGELSAVLELIVRKPDGTIRERRELKSQSFVRQFMDLLWVQMGMVQEVSYLELRDVNNNLLPVAFSSINFSTDALANDDLYGILVGTGAVAPTINDYALGTQIADGVGAGELQHGAVTYGMPTASATVSHFTITRDFSNASGGVVTVNEIALYVKGHQAWISDYDDRDALDQYFMTIRDVIGGGIAVPNGDTLTVNYRLQATA